MTDSVEALVAKRHLGTIRDGDPATIRNPIFHRPFGGDPQTAERKVHEHGVTAGFLRDIKTRPTGASADIQETGTWLETQKPHIAPKTAELYALAITHLKRKFSGMLLSDISADDISRYQAHRMGQKAAGRTINMETGVLRQIMRKHKLWGAISDDVKSMKERRDVGRALSPDEEASLLQAAADRRYKDSQLYVIVVLALNSTMCSQEIKTLRWSHIDLMNRTAIVGKGKTDARTGRVIPLNQTAFAALTYCGSSRADAKPDHYVFPACENHKIDPLRPIKSFRTAWRNATKTAGLAGLRFHDLRHTAITKLAETPASEQTIMSIAGHVSRRMLEHYSHIRMDAKRKALEAIAQPAFQGDGAQNWAQSQKTGKSGIPN